MAIDLGTGDGRFVASRAKADPGALHLGIDANAAGMDEASRKAPANALFVRASVAALPAELDGLACEVTANFPWGSLFEALVFPRPAGLTAVRALLKPAAALTVTTSIDLERDAALLGALDVEPFSADHLQRIDEAYCAAGFESACVRELTIEEAWATGTTWAKKLAASQARRYWRVRVLATGRP